MIVTVTLNPSLDRAMDIETLHRGRVIRATGTHLDPGGKGVNVSRALIGNGIASRAIIPSGGAEGDQLVRLLAEEGVDLRAVPIGGRTRSNVTLVEADGVVTKINESGPELSATELDALIDHALSAGRDARWLVLCGRMAPGMTTADFGRLCARLTATGVPLAVDTSGPPLLAAAEAGAALLKPNRHELSEAVGGPLSTADDVLAAAQRLRTLGAGTVLASLGSRGAVLAAPDGAWFGTPPPVPARSTVGAGDAMLAGFLAAGAAGPEALTEALAWGSAAAGLPGSRMPTPADLHRDGVRVTPIGSAAPHTPDRVRS
ncbi:fructose-1-phosphate kinase [Stackebrandtia albiflava]|uniref:Fructose-1-phosphate kinase n=1 Tax=Stackebrandtia albiflava TaxID=406432 RepID=A0A562VCM9_9ACTN|nr:1-phosphofructokinase family hexose kinase [Stackebrandtia albiflava]TWJ15636.1 fructose-1-phosphate kinase [Stackebrandtia albiflava]